MEKVFLYKYEIKLKKSSFLKKKIIDVYFSDRRIEKVFKDYEVPYNVYMNVDGEWIKLKKLESEVK